MPYLLTVMHYFLKLVNK